MGIVPPDFILDLTLDQMTKTVEPVDKALVVTSIARRGPKRRSPAGDRIIGALEPRRKSTQRRCCRPWSASWRRPRRCGPAQSATWPMSGEVVTRRVKLAYEAALHSTTTTKLSPDEVHKIGLEQGKEISARIDGLLKAQGLTSGSSLGRLRHQAPLRRSQADRRSPTPTRTRPSQEIAYCSRRLVDDPPDGCRPSSSAGVPPYKFEVRRVPELAVRRPARPQPSSRQGRPAIDGSVGSTASNLFQPASTAPSGTKIGLRPPSSARACRATSGGTNWRSPTRTCR